jgi:hypothetical protein
VAVDRGCREVYGSLHFPSVCVHLYVVWMLSVVGNVWGVHGSLYAVHWWSVVVCVVTAVAVAASVVTTVVITVVSVTGVNVVIDVTVHMTVVIVMIVHMIVYMTVYIVQITNIVVVVRMVRWLMHVNRWSMVSYGRWWRRRMHRRWWWWWLRWLCRTACIVGCGDCIAPSTHGGGSNHHPRGGSEKIVVHGKVVCSSLFVYV